MYSQINAEPEQSRSRAKVNQKYYIDRCKFFSWKRSNVLIVALPLLIHLLICFQRCQLQNRSFPSNSDVVPARMAFYKVPHGIHHLFGILVIHGITKMIVIHAHPVFCKSSCSPYCFVVFQGSLIPNIPMHSLNWMWGFD